MLTTPELGALVASFSVTHIGLSAVRESLIDRAGGVAGTLGLVGTGLRLPTFWLADTSGLDVWPDEPTAGRQIYRAGYTAISSALLFPALAAYPELHAAAAAADASSTALSASQWCGAVWHCRGRSGRVDRVAAQPVAAVARARIRV